MGKPIPPTARVRRHAFAVLENRRNLFGAWTLRASKRHSRARLKRWRNAFEEALNRHVETLWMLGMVCRGGTLELPRALMPSATHYGSDFGLLEVKRRKDATAYLQVADLRWPICEIDCQLWQETQKAAG